MSEQAPPTEAELEEWYMVSDLRHTRRLIAEVKLLWKAGVSSRMRIEAIHRHWQEGVSEESERENPWHGKMRDLIQAARAAGGEK